MRKKLPALVLALVMCLGLTVPAIAAETVTATDGDAIITASADGMLSFTFPYLSDDYMISSIQSGIDLLFEMEPEGWFVETENGPKMNANVNFSGSNITTALSREGASGTASFTGTGELTYGFVDMADLGLFTLGRFFGIGDVETLTFNIGAGIVCPEDLKKDLEETAQQSNGRLSVNFESSAPSTPSIPSAPAAPAGLTVNPNSSAVLVNGESVSFDAYTIEGSNYFKLRDLACVLNGTEKQFEVGWDSASKTITLTSGQSYTAAGGEMAAKGSGAQTASASASRLLIDGKEVALTAYTINGNNYFKLRDIGQAFDFGIGWDSASKTITIDTGTGYTA